VKHTQLFTPTVNQLNPDTDTKTKPNQQSAGVVEKEASGATTKIERSLSQPIKRQR